MFQRPHVGFPVLALLSALVVTTSCSSGGAASPPAGAAGGATATGTGRTGDAGGRGGARGAGNPVPVTTTAVVAKPMAVNVRVIGNVEAASTINVRPQITGELKTVDFKEGQEVIAGQLLFTLDPRPLELALRQAEVQLARDTAQWRTADAQLTRSTEMLAKGLVAPSVHEATAATANALKGAMSADQVDIDNAKLQLTYTRITAPVGGRTGALLVNEGSLVRTNDATPMVVINQLSPVFVSFAVPARLLDQIRNERDHHGLKVLASPAGSTGQPLSGTVSFLDNAVEPSTDTIRLKATFPNRDRRLWPGAFVEVTLQLTENPKAIVVPNAAVQASQRGQVVYVVKGDQTVESRSITVAWTEGAETVVATGLTAGETVVTDGQLRLTPGARVAPQTGAGQQRTEQRGQ